MNWIKKLPSLLFCSLLLGSLLTACSLPTSLPAWIVPPTETPIPSPTSVPTKVETPTATVQIVEIIIETEPAPTKTVFIPTETITPTPLSTDLKQGGPWMVYSAVDGMWVINQDGSALTRISEDTPLKSHRLQDGAAPVGPNLVYLTAEKDWYHLTLKIVSLPDGASEVISPLTSPETEPRAGITSAKDLSEDVQVLLQNDTFAWSPGGTHLAFIGAMSGTSTELYLYSVKEKMVMQITSDSGQVLSPVWSPAGTYIVFLGVRSLGDENGYIQMNMWTYRTDTGEVIWLYRPKDSGREVILGWVDDSNFLVYSWNPDGLSNLRRFDITTRKDEVIWEGKFSSAAYDPKSQKIMLVLSQPQVAAEDQGVFLISPAGGDRTFVLIEDASNAEWIPEAGYFSLNTPNGIVMLSPTGNTFRMPVSELGQMFASADGKRLGWYGAGGVLIGEVARLGQNPPVQVYKSPVTAAAWAPDSETIFFFSLGGLFKIQPPYDNPVLIKPGVASQDVAWIKP